MPATVADAEQLEADMEQALVLAVILILAFPIAFIVSLRLAFLRISRLENTNSSLREMLETLSKQFSQLEAELRIVRQGLHQPSSEPAPAPAPDAPGEIIPDRVAEAAQMKRPAREARPDSAPPVPVSPAPPKRPAPLPVPPLPPVTAEKVPGLAAPPSQAKSSAPPQPPPPTPPATRATPSWKIPSLDWESLVGVKLFSWIAGVALLMAAVFFLRYSMDRGWLMPPVRMAIGVMVGIGLLTLCELRAARKYPVTANAMDASAIAILFSTFFAAHSLWHLIGPTITFVLLVLVTVVAVLLSIRRDSMFIALLGLVGGFSTPALLSTGENKPIPLFGYLLLLNVGLAYIASRKKWPLLTTLSLAFTTLYQGAWVMKFLTADQLPLAAGIFLVFPILAFVALAFGQKQEDGASWKSLYGQTANIGAAVPLFFAIYLAAVPGYGAHYAILFGFLFLMAAGLLAVAVARGPELLHFGGALSTLFVWLIWLKMSYQSGAWPGILAFAALFCLLNLAAPLIARRFSRPFKGLGWRAVYAAPLLLVIFPFLAAMEMQCANPALLFSVLFLLVAAASAYAIYAAEGAVYFIAAFFALLAEAVWSQRYLSPERLLAGLAIYGVFAMFYLGVPLLARRWNRPLRPEGAVELLLLVSLGLLFFLSTGPVAEASLWGLALLLLVLNMGLFFQGSASRFPLISIVGVALSWCIIGVWWASVSLTGILLPALVVVAGFAILAMAGNIWLQRRTVGPQAGVLSNGVFLGLAGHLFLFVVAGQKPLAIPPWPLLGILLVLDLGIGVTALYARRGELHLAAVVASSLVLMLWVTVAVVAPWPATAIISAGVLVLFAFAWLLLARRTGIESEIFAKTAAASVFLAQIVLIFAAAQKGSPGVVPLVCSHLALLAALLWLAWVRRWHFLSLPAALCAGLAVFLWMSEHIGTEFWQQQLTFALPVYLVFLAYPLLLGHRVGQRLEVHLAAVVASAIFFFEARHIMLQSGWGHVIGILPVIQALLLVILLVGLLRLQAPGVRTPGRLALVAGAALAFATVAIPLQLEREWITIGWALEGVALAWLFGRIPHRGLFYAANSLMAAAFVRLALNPAVLTYAPRGALRIWNWYLYTYLISGAALILAGWLLARAQVHFPGRLPHTSKLLPAGGIILLFLLLNIEIADFYSEGPSIAFNFSATLAQDLTYTLGWALFAVALLAAGIALRSQAARIAALALLVATIVKCFLHDLARLGGLYRVMSFVGLAICLALVAMALQKFVLSARKETG